MWCHNQPRSRLRQNVFINELWLVSLPENCAVGISEIVLFLWIQTCQPLPMSLREQQSPFSKLGILEQKDWEILVPIRLTYSFYSCKNCTHKKTNDLQNLTKTWIIWPRLSLHPIVLYAICYRACFVSRAWRGWCPWSLCAEGQNNFCVNMSL